MFCRFFVAIEIIYIWFPISLFNMQIGWKEQYVKTTHVCISYSHFNMSQNFEHTSNSKLKLELKSMLGNVQVNVNEVY